MTVLTRKARGQSLARGQWYLNQEAEVAVVCPGCGAVGNLNGHTIILLGTGAGIVAPSLECPCGFHDDVALKDWELRCG